MRQLALSLAAMLFLSSSVIAQTNIYKDLQTPFYDPTSASSCGSTGSSSPGGTAGSGLVWPFASKDSSQYQRVDQGWDIQSDSGAAIFAIAPGIIRVFAPDPGGFGNDYPTEQLDSSIGGPSDWIYYGHVHVLPSVIDQHVTAGQQIAIANTTDPQNGSAAPVGWLEIGFAQPGTDAPVQKGGESVATQAGQQMKDSLVNAQPGSSVTTSGSTSSQCCSSSTNLTGSVNAEKVFNYFLSKGLGAQQVAAITGNMQVESGFDPTSYYPGTNTNNPDPSNAFGIVQWLGGRQTNLRQLADSRGLPITDLGVQLDFAWQELSGSYKSSVLDPIKQSTDLAAMVNIVNSKYESSGVDDGPRLSAAQSLLAQYGSDTSSASSSPTSSCSTPSTALGACNVSAPVYGSVNGSGNEYTQNQLAQIFGNPGTASSHPVMDANLINVDFLGHPVQVNKLAAPCLTAVAKDIQASDVKYTINDMGCYRFDSDNGSSNIGLRSYHTYGAACDINSATNPFSANGSSKPHDMPQEYITAFHNHGFTWGGNWVSVKDYMHFEFNGITPP